MVQTARPESLGANWERGRPGRTVRARRPRSQLEIVAAGGRTMAWIQTIAEEAAAGKLHEVYGRVRERAGAVANIAKLQSLRPKTMEHGFNLYCAT